MLRLKDIVKKALFLIIYALAIPVRIFISQGLLVLTYHRISETPDPDDPLKLSADTFEKQMLYLKNNYSLLSADALSQIIKGFAQLPPKACLVTFDDGWEDNYINAFPILKKHGIPALIFISSDYIGSGKIFWHVRLKNILLRKVIPAEKLDRLLPEWPSSITGLIADMATCSSANRVKLILNLTELLKQFPEDRIELLLNSLGTGPQSFGDERSSMLSWEEAVEMKGSGIAFGSHAKSHGILTLMTVAEVARESIESKDIIQKRLGATVNFFAYPNGDFNESVSKIVKSSGYLAAFTCIPGFNHIAENNFDLKRSNMREDSSDFMGRFSPLFFAVELSGVRLLIKQMLCKGKKN